MTKDEISAAYKTVAEQFGDLQFARETLVAQLKSIDDRLDALRKERAALADKYAKAATEGPADAVAPATDDAC